MMPCSQQYEATGMDIRSYFASVRIFRTYRRVQVGLRISGRVLDTARPRTRAALDSDTVNTTGGAMLTQRSHLGT